MRIAVVSPHLPTPALPMRGRRGSAQLGLLAEAGHDVRGVVPLAWSPRAAPVPDEERDGAVPIAHPRYLRPPRLGGAGLALERRLFARAAAGVLGEPDVVLAHSAILPGGLHGRIGRARFVVTLHDHELYELAPGSRLVRELLVGTLRRADCAVYVSEALLREGERLAGPHRARVIPIGIEPCEGLYAAPPEEFTVCAVARLIPRKRIDRLVRAVARLGRGRLVIVGDGPERAGLERLTRDLGVGARVELTGALDACAAQARMARASVLALPSVRESLGAVYLEAMALGVPALGTRGEGIEATIEHGVSGILVEAGDDEALLGELRALAEDPARARRIGEEGRRRFLAGPFSPRANAEAYLALFDELMGRATQTT